MSTENKNIDYIELISSYLSGELHNNDIIVLENWVRENSENKDLFLAYKNSWISSTIGKNNNLNLNDELAELKLKINFSLPAKKQKNIFVKHTLRIAAVLAIVLAGFAAFNYYLNKQSFIEYSSANNIIEQQTPDGSIIDLNRNTTIIYNKNSKKIREVKLKGSAFFKVKPNKNKPFIIETQNIKITVLGTSFFVDSRENTNYIEVVVKTGKVSVKNNDGEVILLPGEKGIFSKKQNKLYKTTNNNVNFISWKTKIIEFDNTNLTDVVNTINIVYNKNVKIDSKINTANYKLTAKFNNKSFKSVIEIIKETFDLKTIEIDTEIIISE